MQSRKLHGQTMTERNAQPDPNEPPEDVASLYSWANLHGAKYRDFSASRAQTREKARQRVEQAIEEERLKVRQETDAQRAGESMRAREEWDKLEPLPSQPLTHPAAPPTSQSSAQYPSSPYTPASQQTQPHAWQSPRLDRLTAPAAPLQSPPDFGNREVRSPSPDPYSSPASRPPPNPIPQGPMREETYPPSRLPRAGSSTRDETVRPAWLTDRPEPAGPAVPPPPPDDTLQGSRDRLASRWYALQGMFEGSAPPAQTAPAPTAARAPAIAIFSLAGGVGKTSLVATLGRALSARGERVLLVDTAAYGLLPFFFGARDQRPGLSAHLQSSAVQRRRAHPDDHARSGDAGPRERASRKRSRPKSPNMRAASAASSSIWPLPPAPPLAASCACRPRSWCRWSPT